MCFSEAHFSVNVKHVFFKARGAYNYFLHCNVMETLAEEDANDLKLESCQ